MGKKLILLDLDGTALNDQKQLTDGNREAINAALAAGHKVVVTTGRPFRSARAQAERYGLAERGNFIVSYNGGKIYDIGKEEFIFQSGISVKTVRETFVRAAEMGVHIQTYRNEKVLVDPRNVDEELMNYCKKIEMEYEVISDIAMLDEEPSKMHSSMLKNAEKLIPFRDWINETFTGEIHSFLSSPIYLEIVPCGVDKGLAVHKMAEVLDWPIEDIIAVGDQANDVPMIREAGIGAAMINGIDEIKAAADYITTADNNHDGVAEVIRKFALV